MKQKPCWEVPFLVVLKSGGLQFLYKGTLSEYTEYSSKTLGKLEQRYATNIKSKYQS